MKKVIIAILASMPFLASYLKLKKKPPRCSQGYVDGIYKFNNEK